jgi:hypothetical protein
MEKRQTKRAGAPSRTGETPALGNELGGVAPRLHASVIPGPKSGSRVRDVLAELAADADPVALEQIAVLIGALTSGKDHGDGPEAPIELKLWTDPSVVRVELSDPDFSLHRSGGGLVELERTMIGGWRLKLVERLADRWSVTHDRELTLRFEFDSEPHKGGESALEAPGRAVGGFLLDEQLNPPIGGWGSIPSNGRSEDGRNGRPPGE